MIIKDRVVLFLCPQLGKFILDKVRECVHVLQINCTDDVLFSTAIICLPDKYSHYSVHHENVVTPLWLIRSTLSGTLLPLNYFSSDPNKFLSGRILCFDESNINREMISVYNTVIKHLGGLVVDYSCHKSCTDVILTCEYNNANGLLKSNLRSEYSSNETFESLDDLILKNLYNCLYLRSITDLKSYVDISSSFSKTEYVPLSWLCKCFDENHLTSKSSFSDHTYNSNRNCQNFQIIYSSYRYIKRNNKNKHPINKSLFDGVTFLISPYMLESQRYFYLNEIITENGGTIKINERDSIKASQLILVSDFITPRFAGLSYCSNNNISNDSSEMNMRGNMNNKMNIEMNNNEDHKYKNMYKFVTSEYIFECVSRNNFPLHHQLEICTTSKRFSCATSYVNGLMEQILFTPIPTNQKSLAQKCYISVIEVESGETILTHHKAKLAKILIKLGACCVKLLIRGLSTHVITNQSSKFKFSSELSKWSNLNKVTINWILLSCKCLSLLPEKNFLITQNTSTYLLGGGEKLRNQAKFKDVITRLGGHVVWPIRNLFENCTHLILNNTTSRTEKYLCACAAGLWVLNVKYIHDCEITKKLLPEEPYEYLSENILATCCRRWRISHVKPFEMMKIIILGHTTPPVDTLVRIIQAGKGVAVSFLTVESLLNDVQRLNFVDFIVCGDNTNVAQLKSEKNISNALFGRVFFVRALFILDMITVYPLPNITEYLC